MFKQRIDIDREKSILKLCNSQVEKVATRIIKDHIAMYKEDLEEGIDSNLLNRMLISILKQELNKRRYKDLRNV